MNYICLFLMFAVETSALIINGTAETCGSTFCGYRAACRVTDQTCVCPGSRGLSATQAQYCIDSCVTNDDCSNGTICTEDAFTLKCCYCDVDAGYVLSPLGKCINVVTTIKEPEATSTSTEDKLPKSTDASRTECRPNTELVISVVFNGIQLAIFILLVIILLRQCLSFKGAPNPNTTYELKVVSRGDNRDGGLTDIEVTSPVYQNSLSIANVYQSSNGNDMDMPNPSDYVNTAVYDDIDPPVNSDYINTPQPSQEYVGLRLDNPTNQTVYEKLQNPSQGLRSISA